MLQNLTEESVQLRDALEMCYSSVWKERLNKTFNCFYFIHVASFIRRIFSKRLFDSQMNGRTHQNWWLFNITDCRYACELKVQTLN